MSYFLVFLFFLLFICIVLLVKNNITFSILIKANNKIYESGEASRLWDSYYNNRSYDSILLNPFIWTYKQAFKDLELELQKMSESKAQSKW